MLAGAVSGCNPPSASVPVEPVATRAPVVAEAPIVAQAVEAPSEVTWASWEEGSTRAAAANQPMMLFVYADWCGRCSELEPVFSQPAVLEASRGLVMIRHDHDQPAPWLENTVGDTDTYVPRVLFLNPDGSRRAEVSPHPRYPLFYTPSMVDALIANMRAAVGS
jgi:thiol:disulfide interchange protein